MTSNETTARAVPVQFAAIDPYLETNIVTGEENRPQAVLIRACEGADGPGKLTKDLHITGDRHRYALTDESGPLGLEGMDAKSLNKKFKDKKFAAGCSRDVIRQGAEMMGVELNDLFTMTIQAMQE